MAAIYLLSGTVGIATLVLAAVYTSLALVAVVGWGRQKSTATPAQLPPVTVPPWRSSPAWSPNSPT